MSLTAAEIFSILLFVIRVLRDPNVMSDFDKVLADIKAKIAAQTTTTTSPVTVTTSPAPAQAQPG